MAIKLSMHVRSVQVEARICFAKWWKPLSEGVGGLYHPIWACVRYCLISIAKDIVEGSPHNLLESQLTRLQKSMLVKFPQISIVWVKVGIPHVAVQGVLDYLSVEIMRHRKKA